MTDPSWEEKMHAFLELHDLGKDEREWMIEIIQREVKLAKAEMLKEIIEGFGYYNSGCGCCAESSIEDDLQAKYPDLIFTAGDGVTK